MSRLGIKIFIIIITIALAGLFFTSIYLNYNIEHRFRDYLYLEKKEKIEKLVALLESDYEQTGNWINSRSLLTEFIHMNGVILRLEDNSGNIIYDLRGGMMSHGMMGRGMNNMMNRMRNNMRELPRYNNYQEIEPFKYMLESRGRQVARLYWYRLKRGENLSEQAAYFTEKVNRAIFIAAGLVALVTVIISFLFSRYLTKPLLQMNKVAGRVAEGDFEQELDIRGKDEVAELGKALNDMVAKLRHLEKIRRESTSDLAHELRTPLATINSYLESIQDGIIKPDRKTIEEIEEELQRLVRLVNRLGELSEAEKKIVYLEKKKINVIPILREVVNHFRPRAASKNIVINKDFADSEVFLKGDRDSLETIFNNLLSNAIKYTPDGGRIDVCLKQEQQNIIIRVRDNGIGIPVADLPYIFERYYRTDKSRSSKTGGTGIGLTITRELVKALGGKIEVDSNKKGTIFTIIFNHFQS